MLAYTTKFGAFNHRFLPAALLINVHTGFTCFIEHWILYITPLELDTLTMEPRVEIGQSFTSEDFGTAVHEPRPSLPLPVKRSSGPHRETYPRRKRYNGEDSDDTRTTSVSP